MRARLYFMIAILSVLFAIKSTAQNNINLSVLLDSMGQAGDTLHLEGTVIDNDLESLYGWNLDNYRAIIREDYDSSFYRWKMPGNKTYTCRRPVVFKDCRFQRGFGFMPSIRFQSTVDIINSFNNLRQFIFSKCTFLGDVNIEGVKNLLLYKCTFENDLFIELVEKGGGFNAVSCTFVPRFDPSDDDTALYMSYLTLRGQDVDFVQLANCNFPVTNHPGLLDLENLTVQNCYLTRDTAAAKLFLQRTMVWGTLNVRDCQFRDKVVMNSCKFPIDNFYFPFSQIESQLSTAYEQGEAITLHDTIISIGEVTEANVSAAGGIQATLSRLNISYKNSGDNEGADQTFLLQKNIDLLSKEAALDAHFTLKNLADFRVSQFIGWYSDYGTNTLKCLRRTLEIVEIYLGRYKIPHAFLRRGKRCFSRWSALYRLASRTLPAAKKKRPRPAPGAHKRRAIFCGWAIHLSHNFFHALLLSTNAFLTLGYGELTASNRLKYLYVLEGVVGWFLVSFLTASILAQTLQ